MELNFTPSHKKTIAVLDKKGGFFIAPQSCKDYIHDALSGYFYPEYTQLWSIWSPFKGREPGPDLDNPQFVLFCGKKSCGKNARKFQRLFNELEELMSLEDRTTTHPVTSTGVGENSAPFIASTHSFWIRSPVLVSAFCMFLRMTIRMHVDESFKEFVERIRDDASLNYSDAAYLKQAIKNGNFTGLVEKSLPCMHREGYSDYLLSSHGRGFAFYHSASDEQYPMSEKDLKVLRIEGRKSDLNRW